jgi:hypothetical protein
VWFLLYYSAWQTVVSAAALPVTSMEVAMCDYSLEAYQSRPAEVGEKLTLGRFPSGSMGFASGTVCDTAVCIPDQSKLLLEGIGEVAQKAYGVGAVEEVAMTRLDNAGPYKDAVRFSNGTEVLLQRLDCGSTAVVMSVGGELIGAAQAEPAAREPEFV